MPPIQVPELKRNMQVPASPSAGQIKGQFQDTSAATGAMGEATQKVLQTGIDIFQKAEEDEIDNAKIKAQVDYNTWFKTKMYGDSETGALGLVDQEGDPTQMYNEFDKEAKKKFDELVSNQNLSEKGREKVTGGLLQTHSVLHGNRLVAYGNQHQKYQENLTNSALSLVKESAADSMQFAKADDPASFAFFDQSLNRIREEHVKYGLKVGTANDDENGTPFLIDGQVRKLNVGLGVAEKMKKDFSEATTSAVTGLIASKRLGEADYVMKNYANYIDPINKAKLTKAYKEADIDQKSLMVTVKVGDKSIPEQIAFLRNMKPKNAEEAEVKIKAMERLDATQRMMDNAKDRASKDRFDMLANKIQEQMRGKSPYATATELDNASIQVGKNSLPFKELVKGVSDANQRKALYEMIERPKESNPEVKMKMMNKMVEPDGLYNMEYGDVVQATAGLNDEDKNFIEKEWYRQKHETPAEERARINFVDKQVMDQFVAAGFYERNEYEVPTSEARQNLAKFQIEMKNYFGTLPKNLSTDQINSEIKKKVANTAIDKKGGMTYKGGTTFTAPGYKPKYQGIFNAVPSQAPKRMSPQELETNNQRFFDKKGREPETLDELKEFLEQEEKEN